MKQILITAILALFLSTSLHAQQKKPTNLKYFSIELLDELEATPEQKEQIKNLVVEANSKIQKIKKDISLSDDEKKVRVKEVISVRAKAYYNTLTAEQNEKLNKMKKEHAEKNENQ